MIASGRWNPERLAGGQVTLPLFRKSNAHVLAKMRSTIGDSVLNCVTVLPAKFLGTVGKLWQVKDESESSCLRLNIGVVISLVGISRNTNAYHDKEWNKMSEKSQSADQSLSIYYKR